MVALKTAVLESVQRDRSTTTMVLDERYNMRNRIGVMIAIGMTLGVGSAFAQTGNGATSGSHYNLNILGKTDCTPADLTGSDRHTIQVLLNGGQSVTDINGMPITVLDKQNKIF